MLKRPRLVRSAIFATVVIAMIVTAVSGMRTYRSFVLLRTASEAGVPDACNIRAWMTLRHVSQSYGAPESVLIERLGLPPDTDPNASLRSLAGREGSSAFEYVQRVQRALFEVAPDGAAQQASESVLEAIGDRFLAAVLAYGYPVLALVLLLGALGLPVPTGLSVALAGSLIARGSMSWAWVGALAVTASVLGDVAGYGLGRAASATVLDRYGRWVGYTARTRTYVQSLFERWGVAAVFLSRTLASHMSAVLNVVAGASRYRPGAFVVFTIAGRIVWVSAYLLLGFAVGASIEAASGLLANLSVFLLSVAILTMSTLAAYAVPRPPSIPRP
jgi:membrane protein DedA with SNARE-associated domain